MQNPRHGQGHTLERAREGQLTPVYLPRQALFRAFSPHLAVVRIGTCNLRLMKDLRRVRAARGNAQMTVSSVIHTGPRFVSAGFRKVGTYTQQGI